MWSPVSKLVKRVESGSWNMEQIEPGPKFRLGNVLSLKLRTWLMPNSLELRTWKTGRVQNSGKCMFGPELGMETETGIELKSGKTHKSMCHISSSELPEPGV